MGNKFKEINLEIKIYKTEIKNIIIEFNCRLYRHKKIVNSKKIRREYTHQSGGDKIMDNEENITGYI